MKLLNFAHSLFQRLNAGARRFPLPSLCIVMLTIAVMPSFGLVDDIKESTYFKILYCCITGFCWFLSAHIAAETHPNRARAILLGAASGFTALTIAIFSNIFQPLSMAYLAVAIALSVLIAPYFFQLTSNGVLWTYNYRVATGKGFAFITALLLGGGISVGLFAISELFSIHINSNAWGNVWTLALCCLAPFCLLGEIPTDFSEDKTVDADGIPHATRFINTWVLIPIAFGYLAILYCYYIKLMLVGETPRGMLGSITIAFGVVGMFTWMATLPFVTTGNAAVQFFHKHFHHMLLLPAAVLIYAIMLRIQPYGFTVERYFVLLTALWFFAYCIVHQLTPQKAYKLTIACFIVMVLGAGFSPLGADRVVGASQYNRLVEVFRKEGLLDAQGTPIAATKPVDASSIRSILDELVATDFGKDRLKELFAHNTEVINALNNDFNKNSLFYNPSYYNATQAIEKQLKIAYSPQADPRGNIRLNATLNDSDAIISSEGYRYAVPIAGYANNPTFSTYRGQTLHYEYRLSDAQLSITLQGQPTLHYDLSALMADIASRKPPFTTPYATSIDIPLKNFDPALIIPAKEGTSKLLITSIYIETNTKHEHKTTSLRGYILTNDMKP